MANRYALNGPYSAAFPAGWSFSRTGAGTTEIVPYVVSPSRLRRVWAGDDPLNPVTTIALRFADEAEAAAALS